MKTIGFIGSGRIARIMLEGWDQAGALADTVVAFDAKPLGADDAGIATFDRERPAPLFRASTARRAPRATTRALSDLTESSGRQEIAPASIS